MKIGIALLSLLSVTGWAVAEPLQRDEVAQEETTTTSEPVSLELEPEGKVSRVQGDDLKFECKITNKPRNSQVQWYYMIRNPIDNSFENFTILANEVATVDPNKYSVWTTPPNLYSLQIEEMKPSDSGEYCCFLYVSYSETYRQITEVEVTTKRPPETTVAPTTAPTTTRGYDHRVRVNGTQPGSRRGHSKLDDIIEEAVEHDIEEELGKKLNITMIKNNAQARTLIQNATEEIKSLLDVSEDSGMEFNNATTRLTVTRKMKGVSSKVRTVVTTLISKISSVDATLAQALAPLHRREDGQSDYVAKTTDTIPDWRRLYNEYRRARGRSPNVTQPAGNVAPEQPGYNRIPNSRPTPPPPSDPSANREQEEEETNNIIGGGVVETDSPQGAPQENTPVTVHKCQYQLVINEFDPSQCPSIGTNRGHAAAAYYAEENEKAAAYTQEPIGRSAAPPAPDAQLARLENKLIEEMANSQMVNKTVVMHDSMLHAAEQTLERQTDDIARLEEKVDELREQLSDSRREKEDMEDKLTEVMLNMLEVNKRLDVAMKRKGDIADSKQIGVVSAADTVTCDRHPNVTHFKDCGEVAMSETGAESGVYYIRPLYSACPIPVWCDMDTYPGGWTVLQRRGGGTVQFNRDWESYRKGFGQVTGEHWLGNDNIFLLSNQDEYMMRVDLWDFYDSRVFAEYRMFKIEGERDGYRLSVGNYSGTAGDGLKSHNKVKFSTLDNDNDLWQDYHCSYEWEGGWWFTNCWSSYLNGKYYNISDPPYNGISWREWKEEQLYKSEIKIRPVFYVRTDNPADAEVVPEDSQSATTEVADDQPAAYQRDEQRDQPQREHRPLQQDG